MIDVERFWSKVERREVADCWNWLGGKTTNGYGGFYIGKRRFYTHRLSWELANGPIPHGMHVLHKCDNPPCCNPEHLFIGTNSDNIADKVSKGRQMRGESTPSAKLTEDEVRELRGLAQAGVTQQALAERFGLSIGTVNWCIRRKTWAHVA